MSGFFNPWSHWDISEEIKREDWIVKAECGMDLTDFPKDFKQRKHIHARNIYAPKNGILKRVVFDEFLTSRIFPKYEAKNYILHNIFVIDYKHKTIIEKYYEADSVPPLQFLFHDEKEANMMASPESDEFYKHITFEYSDQY